MKTSFNLERFSDEDLLEIYNVSVFKTKDLAIRELAKKYECSKGLIIYIQQKPNIKKYLSTRRSGRIILDYQKKQAIINRIKAKTYKQYLAESHQKVIPIPKKIGLRGTAHNVEPRLVCEQCDRKFIRTRDKEQVKCVYCLTH